MADKKSWRERDRQKDSSSHRDHRGPGRQPRLETATAAYKRKLNAVFDGGELPAHLKAKLGDGAGQPTRRQELMRELKSAPSGRKLHKAIDKLREEFGLPEDDMEVLLKCLEHTNDDVLFEALGYVDAYLESGQALPRKTLFKSKIDGLQYSSFDPRVQRLAMRLAGALR